jgi:SRSO17 transposase
MPAPSAEEVPSVDYHMGGGGEQRLHEFFDQVGRVLRNRRRRASFAMYAMGLLSDGERKSMEPIAARACAAPDEVDAVHQRLGHFLTDSAWSDRDVRRAATSYALSALTAREPVDAWIVDDTGFLKQGKHSVGVQRQYTGSAGKVTNCQIGVSLSVTTRTEHLPVDFELYLPRSWTEDGERRQEARIPSDVVFRTKPELALRMIDRALEDHIPRGVVLADEGYGNSSDFRSKVRVRGLDYGVAINANTAVWLIDRKGTLGRVKWGVSDLAKHFGRRRFRRTTWREGTRGKLSARFAARRVVVAHDDGSPPAEREPLWLLMEWRDGEPGPAHFYLLTLPERTSRKKMVRLIKERYRTERAYEDLKGELGLDHFEGRRFPGWHHHVSVALCCYAFITAERARAFPPSGGRSSRAGPDEVEAGTPLRGLVHHGPPCDCSCAQHVASAMPGLSLHGDEVVLEDIAHPINPPAEVTQ